MLTTNYSTLSESPRNFDLYLRLQSKRNVNKSMYTTHTFKKTYRAMFRRMDTKESGICYGPVLKDVKASMLSRITQPENIRYVVEEGRDGLWTTIEDSGYYEPI